MAKEKAAKTKKKGNSSKTTLLLVLGIGLAFLIKSTLVLLLIGMIPSIVAFYVDSSATKKTFLTVFLCNFAGVLPPVADLVAQHNTMSAFQQTFGNPGIWLMMYLSAGLGWALDWGMPRLAYFTMEFTNQTKIAQLEFRQQRLMKEWGPDIQEKE